LAIILALDVGQKTIGVAASDETETFAFPGKTILRQEGHRRDMAALRQVIEERGVQEIVVGLPLMMDGSRGIQAEKIEAFVEILKRYTRLPIHLQDERLSTSEVDRMLMSAGRRRDERKQVVDSGAASVILQSFMDRRKRQAGAA
jgi:putative Holliday junction resolvase